VNRVGRSNNENEHEMLAEGHGEAMQGDRVIQPVTNVADLTQLIFQIILCYAVTHTVIRRVLDSEYGFLPRQSMRDLWRQSDNG